MELKNAMKIFVGVVIAASSPHLRSVKRLIIPRTPNAGMTINHQPRACSYTKLMLHDQHPIALRLINKAYVFHPEILPKRFSYLPSFQQELALLPSPGMNGTPY